MDLKEVKLLPSERSEVSGVALPTKLDLGELIFGEVAVVGVWSEQIDLVSFLFRSLLVLVSGDGLDAGVAFFFQRET